MAFIMIPLYTFVFAGFILFDLLPIVQTKRWKVFCIYTTLLAVSIVLNVLYALNIKLPSPAGFIKRVISLIFNMES